MTKVATVFTSSCTNSPWVSKDGTTHCLSPSSLTKVDITVNFVTPGLGYHGAPKNWDQSVQWTIVDIKSTSSLSKRLFQVDTAYFILLYKEIGFLMFLSSSNLLNCTLVLQHKFKTSYYLLLPFLTCTIFSTTYKVTGMYKNKPSKIGPSTNQMNHLSSVF